MTTLSRISQGDIIIFGHDIVESDNMQVINAFHQFYQNKRSEFQRISKSYSLPCSSVYVSQLFTPEKVVGAINLFPDAKR